MHLLYTLVLNSYILRKSLESPLLKLKSFLEGEGRGGGGRGGGGGAAAAAAGERGGGEGRKRELGGIQNPEKGNRRYIKRKKHFRQNDAESSPEDAKERRMWPRPKTAPTSTTTTMTTTMTTTTTTNHVGAHVEVLDYEILPEPLPTEEEKVKGREETEWDRYRNAV